MNRYRLLLTLCCFIVQVSLAQPQAAYAFTHYSMLSGLASNEVNQIAQDRTGYLWIATNNGLQRFDGVTYKTFQQHPGDASGFSNNNVLNVLADNRGRLFLLFAGDYAGIFDPATFSYKPCAVKPRNAASLRTESRFITDEAGHIFLLLRTRELLQYIEAKNEFSATENMIPLKPEWRITTMSQQPGTQKYWLGLFTGGIVIYNHQTGNFSYKSHNMENEPAVKVINENLIGNSMFDAKGRFWFDNWAAKIIPHAVYYDTHKPTDSLHRFQFISTLKAYHETGGFMQQQDGRIWVKGLKVFGYYTEGDKEFQVIGSDYKTEQGILYEEVTFLFEDREKNVWVCTRNNGLYRCNPSQQFFTNVWHAKPGATATQDGGIMSFMEVKNDEVLAGSWGQGIIRYDKNFKLLRFGIKGEKKDENPFAWSMCASADSQTIWMGAQPGLYTYDKRTEIARFRDPAILQHKTIEQVAEDKNGNLWLGLYYGGIYRWIEPKDFKKDSIIRIEGAGLSTVNKILCDSKGLVWIATDTAGLFLFEGATGSLLQHYTSYTKSAGDGIGQAVSSVMEYNDSLVLIANATQLFFYNRAHKSIRPIYLPQPLMGNITSFQKDDEGNIWISTTNGLYRMHPGKRTFVFFNRMDGIANDHFELNASYKMKDGRLLFGNTNSFIIFDPKAIQLNNKQAPIAFTGITAGKSELPVDSILNLKTLLLDHKHNSLTITFSALNFSSPSLIQYKMEGLDDDWHFADKDNRASFPFLPPGRYKLLLRTLNSEGLPSDKPTELLIRIKPPFYQTWWFYALVALGFVFELYWLDRQRGLRKKGLQKVRTDISDNLHKEIAEALNNINILSEIARLKSDKEPAKAREYMEQIHAKSHNMIIAMDDMLWSLDPANDSMDKTISRIKEFADALMQRHAVLIELLIDKNVVNLQLNMKLRHEAFLLFKEGLRSLVGAGTPHCIVHLAMEKARLLFTIEFENEGCDRQQLNNLLHRRDIEARLTALGGKLHVQLHKSRSVFLLQLPLG